jgi:hypothetical protein
MSGLLGQIFSAGNVAKRQLRDLLGNPVLSAQQMAGNLNDRARNLNEMTSAAAREGMDYGPATQRLAGLMADAYNPMGITVYHGSPYKFNKFDSSKIGTGVTDTSGELLYKELTQQFKFAGSKTPEADASEFLRSQGIPGMSHLDAGSRTRTQGEGTQNFVVFPGNEDLLTILRRNGGLLD